MEDGQDDKVATGDEGDDGQRGVHGRGPGDGDWGEATEPPHKPRGAQQGDELADDIGEQGHRAEFGAAILGDEDAGERIVTEACADGKAVGNAVAGKQERGQEYAAECAGDGDEGQEEQTGIDVTDAAEHAGVAADAHADEEHEGAKGVETYIVYIGKPSGHEVEQADERA